MHDEVREAQARRIEELERRLAERTRVLQDAAAALSGELQRREAAQRALLEAQEVEAVGHLASGLAHDLRNVLLALNLGHEVLEERAGDAAVAREVASNGRAAVAQATDLVSRMLTLTRPGVEAPGPLDLAASLGTLEPLLRYAVGVGVLVRLRVAPGLWPVTVDEHRLGAALVNLAVNARDAMPGGGELVVTAGNLPAGAPRPADAPPGDLVVLTVTDTGEGMPPEVLARATEPLFSTKPRGRGTGLGLYMVERFVTAAGGHLRLLSEPGEGTQVELFLPGLAPATPLPAVLPGPTRATAGTLLLVVEDDLARLGLATTLRGLGHEVLEAPGVEVALALLVAVPRLELVVADLALPGAGAAGLVRRVRAERPGAPALLLYRGGAPASPLPGVPVLSGEAGRARLEEAVRAALAQAPERVDPGPAMLDRLLVRLRSPELLAAVLAWRDARGAAFLPPLEAVREPPPSLREHAFLAALEGDEVAPSFRYLWMGRALARAAGRHLEREVDAGTGQPALGTLMGAYRRAARAGLPSYEYARYALAAGPPVLFERLLLPASLDGRKVSHLLGIVLFHNFPAGTEGEATR